MKDGASRKKLSPRDIRALKRAKTIDTRNETDVSNLEAETVANEEGIKSGYFLTK